MNLEILKSRWLQLKEKVRPSQETWKDDDALLSNPANAEKFLRHMRERYGHLCVPPPEGRE